MGSNDVKFLCLGFTPLPPTIQRLSSSRSKQLKHLEQRQHFYHKQIFLIISFTTVVALLNETDETLLVIHFSTHVVLSNIVAEFSIALKLNKNYVG